MTNSPAVKEAAWPIGTFCLMAVCMGVFVLISLGRFPTALKYAVVFGPDMQPWQWFTSQAIHATPVQLTACMACLLVLGSIVEARVGLQWMIGLFVGLGAAGQAVAQMALLDSKHDGLSLGAGASLCGLAGLLVVWSPITKVTHLGKVRLGNVSIPMWAILLASTVIVMSVYSFVLGPFSLFPQAISLSAGALMGAMLLKSKVVEGDHQDLLTIISGTGPGGRKERRKQLLQSRAQAEEAEHVQQQLVAAQEQLESYLAAGQLAAALALISKMSHLGDGLQISSAQLTAIIRGLHKQKNGKTLFRGCSSTWNDFPKTLACA